MKRLVLLAALAACGDNHAAAIDGAPMPDTMIDAYPADHSVEQPGMYAAGTTRFTAHDDATGRDLVMQAWYPTSAVATATPIQNLEDAHLADYATLLGSAPAACPTRMVTVAIDAPVATGTFPLVAFSHCHDCTRLSNASTAERMATHGFIVVAVDHAGNTLWDHLNGIEANLDAAELDVRAGDVSFAIDTMLAGTFAASIDPAKIGVFGHSFGSVTAGRVAELDPRIQAVGALCAPIDNPLVTGVMSADVPQPILFMEMEEDNSILSIGNFYIDKNYQDAPGEAWEVTIPDAGHWSVSDLDGLVDIFAPGCGDGVRQTTGDDFTYLDPATGRGITAAYVTAFFKATLLGDQGAAAYLVQSTPPNLFLQHHH
ncbi:MAG TPA: hypothetical protein VGM88_18715 [Kofleriaceae bacterium]